MKFKRVTWANVPVNVPGVAFRRYETETAFQIYCADWLRKQAEITGLEEFRNWHHSANEREGAKAGFFAKMLGQSKGYPDFVHHGLKFSVEFKVAGRPVTPEQREWLNHFEKLGYKILVCRKFEEFKEMVLTEVYNKRSKNITNITIPAGSNGHPKVDRSKTLKKKKGEM